MNKPVLDFGVAPLAADDQPSGKFAVDAEPPPLRSPDELRSAALVAAYETWCTLKGSRIAPRKDEIHPRSFKRVLASAFLLEVIDEGADYRVALNGDRLMRFMRGRITKGSFLSSSTGSVFHQRAFRALGHCVKTRQPVVTGPRASWAGHGLLSLEVLLLPLSDDGERVSNILGAIHATRLENAASDFTGDSLFRERC